MKRRLAFFYLIGAASLLVAAMSLVDMFVEKPWDGITPAPAAGRRNAGILVDAVESGSGAARAGIAPGDRVLGIGTQIVNTPSEAAAELLRHEIGRPVRYLVARGEGTLHVEVVPEAILFGNQFFIFDAILAILFFLVGLFVLTQRPEEESAQVFFLLADLFLVFLLCRLRPSSYYWIDYFVQNAGTVALFLLPAVFLHFFLIFPERKVFNLLGEDDPYAEPPTAFRLRLDRWVNRSRLPFVLIYLLPPIAYLVHLAGNRAGQRTLSGAPAVNWILLGNYLVLGLLALAHSWLRATDEKKRRQILPVLLGSILGTAPFVFFSVVLPSLTRDDRFVLYGTLPLVLIPVTFGYAIVRYQLLNVRLVIRKGLLYALTTAFVTALYALAIASANRLLANSWGGSSVPAFALAVGVVLLFDPLRRRMQAPVDRIFFRERGDFTRAIREMSEAVRGELSLDRIKRLLTERVTAVTAASGAWLCLPTGDGDFLCETAGGEECPPSIPAGGTLADFLREGARPHRIDFLAARAGHDDGSAAFLRAAESSGVRLAVPMVYRERLLGVLFLKEKLSEQDYGREEQEMLSTLANQVAVALETAKLADELTRQVELARDLEIAREIQMSLFPQELPAPTGIELAAGSIPAMVVGGDFYDVFEFDGDPPAADRPLGLLLGDVSGKSIPASLLMVASREILWAAAHDGAPPAAVFRQANERIYSIKRRMFVALGYYVLDPKGRTLRYSLAGMPTPLLLRKGDSVARPLETPEHRLPLGALRDVPYDERTLDLVPGDLLFFYSDGFNETMDPAGDPFGDDRLGERLAELRDQPLERIGAQLVADVRRHSAGADPYDDMTWLLLRVTGTKP